MSFDTVTHKAPAAWASYLINGDATGIEDSEQSDCDAWLESIGLGGPVDVEECGFDVVFLHGGARFAGDVAEYSFLEGRAS